MKDIGSDNIGTDLMIKVMRLSNVLEMGAFVGIGYAALLQANDRALRPETQRGVHAHRNLAPDISNSPVAVQNVAVRSTPAWRAWARRR